MISGEMTHGAMFSYFLALVDIETDVAGLLRREVQEIGRRLHIAPCCTFSNCDKQCHWQIGVVPWNTPYQR